jgi:hypothetical protein
MLTAGSVRDTPRLGLGLGLELEIGLKLELGSELGLGYNAYGWKCERYAKVRGRVKA